VNGTPILCANGIKNCIERYLPRRIDADIEAVGRNRDGAVNITLRGLNHRLLARWPLCRTFTPIPGWHARAPAQLGDERSLAGPTADINRKTCCAMHL